MAGVVMNEREARLTTALREFYGHLPVSVFDIPNSAGATQLYISHLLAVLAISNDAEVIVESGVYEGHTSVHLAHAARALDSRYVGFDIEEDSPNAYSATLDTAREKIAAHDLEEWASFVSGCAPDAIADHFGPEEIDFIFIDDNHDWKHVQREVEVLTPLIKPGGLVCFHDATYDPLWENVFEDFGVMLLTPHERGLGVWRKPDE